MRRVFADAGYFIALLIPSDDLARSARALNPSLQGTEIVTTDTILFEVLAHVCAMGAFARGQAVDMARRLRDTPGVILVAQSSELVTRALALFDARPDKSYSLTDCLSMVVCRDLGITEVLTHDHHLEREGLTILP